MNKTDVEHLLENMFKPKPLEKPSLPIDLRFAELKIKTFIDELAMRDLQVKQLIIEKKHLQSLLQEIHSYAQSKLDISYDFNMDADTAIKLYQQLRMALIEIQTIAQEGQI